ncbi:MAG: DegV family protein [Cellulosilyticaceae bacterium]
MKYGIVVDSSCDLRHLAPEFRTQVDFTKAPLKLDIGEKEFIDDATLNIASFMTEMSAYKGKTGSAAPSPDAWLSGYEKSECVFVLTITSALSGSYGSAQIAVDLFKEQYPDRHIHLIDTKSTGPEMTLIAYKLCEYIAADLPFDEIVTRIEAYRAHTHLLFVLSSLDNLIKNGRVSKLQGSIAGILGIKLYGIATEEGTLGPLGKCRGKLTAFDKTVSEIFARGYDGGKVVIAHCFADTYANYVADQIRAKYPSACIEIMPTGGLCSYYAEQGGILIGFESN